MCIYVQNAYFAKIAKIEKKYSEKSILITMGKHDTRDMTRENLISQVCL